MLAREEAETLGAGVEDEDSCISALSAALVRVDPFAYPGSHYADTASRLLLGFKAHTKVLATLLLLPPLRVAITRYHLQAWSDLKAAARPMQEKTAVRLKPTETPVKFSHEKNESALSSRIISVYQRLYEEADHKRSLMRKTQVLSESLTGHCSSETARSYEQLCLSARTGSTKRRNSPKKPGSSLQNSSLSAREDSHQGLYSNHFLRSVPNSASVPNLKSSSLIHHKLYTQSAQLNTKKRKAQIAQETKKREGATFTPNVNRDNRTKAQAPAYARLYEMGEALRKKLELRREAVEEKPPKVVPVPDNPRYEVLYHAAQEKPQRRAELRAKVNTEQGVSFVPQTNRYRPGTHTSYAAKAKAV